MCLTKSLFKKTPKVKDIDCVHKIIRDYGTGWPIWCNSFRSANSFILSAVFIGLSIAHSTDSISSFLSALVFSISLLVVFLCCGIEKVVYEIYEIGRGTVEDVKNYKQQFDAEEFNENTYSYREFVRWAFCAVKILTSLSVCLFVADVGLLLESDMTDRQYLARIGQAFIAFFGVLCLLTVWTVPLLRVCTSYRMRADAKKEKSIECQMQQVPHV